MPIQLPPALTPELQARLKQALEFHQKGDFTQAEPIYIEILEQRPDHPDALHLLGLLAARSSDHQRAIELIGRAIKSYANNAYFHSNLGNSLLAVRQFARALNSYEQALAIRPDFAEASYNRGVVLQEMGRIDEAIASYDRAITLRPDYADAFYNRGNILLALGNAEAALSSYDQAIAVSSPHAQFFQNRGNALRALGRQSDAITSYDKAIALRPGYATAFYNRGGVQRALGRLEDALASYEKAISLNSQFAEAYCDRGVTLQGMGRLSEARASLDQAIALRPGYAEAYNNRGVLHQQQQQLKEAMGNYDEAIRYRPDYPDAWLNRGAVLQELGDATSALISCDRAISLKPDYAEAYNNRGLALNELKRFGEAVEAFDQAIALRQDYPEAYNSRGSALQGLLRLEEALESHERAVALNPQYAEGWYDRGVALQLLTRIDDAADSYRRAMALAPKYHGAIFNLSLVLLMKGEFEEGWRLYESRWQLKNRPSPIGAVQQPQWSGKEPIAGKTVLIHSEQGFGDMIQFCRYATQLARLGARVVLAIPSALGGLLKEVEGVSAIVYPGELLPHFDYYCPLLSLPLAFNTRLGTIPASPSYLRASPEKVTAWGQRLESRVGPKIGLAWSGSREHVLTSYRSFALAQLIPFLPDGYQYVCLQKEISDADKATLDSHGNILYVGDELNDFSDTAALCQQMDLVISVDTSVAHLAGALGRPLWVLLSTVSDWRWLLDREDSPWYPEAKLYRQSCLGDWSSLLLRVKEDIQGYFEERCAHR